jgi:L-fucose mutarotase/ribose pyranase (RbsD/FucU family)
MIRAKFYKAHIWLWIIVLPAVIALTSGCGESWQDKLTSDLSVMGHRNWIVIADSAYPAQNRAGIETIVTGWDHVKTVKAVLDAVDIAPHVQPVIYLDSELKSVSKADAPGIEAYRNELNTVLEGRNVSSIHHEELIAKLDEAAKMFRILILKTDMTLPYTSVFIQLDCGYWNANAEKRLRDRIRRPNR